MNNNSHLVIYEDNEGRILNHSKASEGTSFLLVPVIPEDATNTLLLNSLYYINEGVICERPVLELNISTSEIKADGLDVVTISNVPEGAILVSPDRPTSIMDSSETLEFVTDTVGLHIFRISAWPYQDVEVTINAI